MDDRRVGTALRQLRRRRGLRQSDVAERAGVGQSTVSRVELGHLDTLSLSTVRRVFAVLDARFDGEVRWRGGALDRLLDERHAAVSQQVAAVLGELGWTVAPEVTFSHFGERGSIDLIGGHPVARAIAVLEVKTELTSLEETLRRLDTKVRLAPRLAEERFGWRPAVVGRILVLPATTSNRERVGRVGPLLDSALPARALQIRDWLRRPNGALADVWLLRPSYPRGGKCSLPPPTRVRRPGT